MQLNIKTVCSGANHNLLLTKSGQILSWGSNIHGECGHDPNHNDKLFKPLVIYSADISNNLVTQIECGDNFSGFVTESGSVFAFGDNSEGQLGVGMDELREMVEPTRVNLNYDETIKQVSFGYRHMLLLSRRGDVYGAGSNQDHQLGLGSQINSAQRKVSSPIKIQALGDLNIKLVVAGGFSAVLTHEGEIYVWSEGEFGSFNSP